MCLNATVWIDNYDVFLHIAITLCTGTCHLGSLWQLIQYNFYTYGISQVKSTVEHRINAHVCINLCINSSIIIKSRCDLKACRHHSNVTVQKSISAFTLEKHKITFVYTIQIKHWFRRQRLLYIVTYVVWALNTCKTKSKKMQGTIESWWIRHLVSLIFSAVVV